MGGGDEIADRLDRADLVVDQHRRDEAAFGDQRLVGRQRLPRAIDRQDRGVQSFEAYQRRRSEEHTSELQSLMRTSYAVFCLKKKQTKRITSDNRRATPAKE